MNKKKKHEKFDLSDLRFNLSDGGGLEHIIIFIGFIFWIVLFSFIFTPYAGFLYATPFKIALIVVGIIATETYFICMLRQLKDDKLSPTIPCLIAIKTYCILASSLAILAFAVLILFVKFMSTLSLTVFLIILGIILFIGLNVLISKIFLRR